MSEHNEISRRNFLQTAAVAPFAASAVWAMQKSVPVGLELYSVRTELMKDLPGTVTAVAKTGLPGRRVLFALFRLDATSREGRPQAARRSRDSVPIDAQRTVRRSRRTG